MVSESIPDAPYIQRAMSTGYMYAWEDDYGKTDDIEPEWEPEMEWSEQMKVCEFCKTGILDESKSYKTPTGCHIHDDCMAGYAHENDTTLGFEKGDTNHDPIRNDGTMDGGALTG